MATESASLVGLKAELLRKQEEFKQERTQNKSSVIRGRQPPKFKKKSSILSIRNRGVAERAQKDYEAMKEEENVMERSKIALQAKTKLYDDMAKKKLLTDENDSTQPYLVNFEQKTIDEVLQKKRREDVQKEIDEYNEGKGPDEWVDYLDAEDRRKSCLRKDLNECEEKVASLRILRNKEVEHKDKLHAKWVQDVNLAEHQPVHYTNILFDENRSHGVGYYQFSKDDDERREQLAQLGKLRQQTKEQQIHAAKLKVKRHAMLKERLEKVKLRRIVRMGGVDIQIAELDPSIVALAKSDGKEVEPEPAKIEVPDIKDAPVREWDKGKQAVMDGDEIYYEEQRSHRESEFAPPVQYYENSTNPKGVHREAHVEEPEEYYEQPEEIPRKKKKKKKKRSKKSAQKSNTPSGISTGISAIRQQIANAQDIANIPLPPGESDSSEDENVIGPMPAAEDVQEHHSYSENTDQGYTTYQHGYTAPGHGYAGPEYGYTGHGYTEHYDYTASYYPETNYQNTSESSHWNHGHDIDYTQQESTKTELPSQMPGYANATQQVPQVQQQSWNDDTQPAPAGTSGEITALNSVHSVNADNMSTQPNTVNEQAPQPAHYSSAPTKPDHALKATYERVHLHEVPKSLPVPPSVQNMPAYPSQENPHLGTQADREKKWQNQYGRPSRDNQKK